MRGICILHDEIPIILLNGKDNPNGRINTLFHESHLLLWTVQYLVMIQIKDVEIFCNSLAGEYLVPKDDLILNVNDSIKNLSNRYSVSQYVIYRLLLDTNNISQEEYNLKTEHNY